MVCVEMVRVDIKVEFGDLLKRVAMWDGPGLHRVER